MRELWLVARLDVGESLRARWFTVYAGLFGAIVALLFAFGLTESRILGFMGLSRLLVTYIQLCMAILPVFVLITTVRSVAGDREAGVFEYLLALPISLSAWFWGKLIGRFLVIYLPVLLAMAAAAGWATLRDISVPWDMFAIYAALLAALALCFLGIAMGISAAARSVDVAQGAAFLVWLALILVLDLVLLGVLIKGHAAPELVIAIALANPLQAFRSAALLLFDPQLVLLGPAAFVILDAFGRDGFLAYAMAYPALVGVVCAAAGYLRFRRGDLP
ncbi:MAG: ABC transporter permease subunit [Deltaproteobacteria bacterium]|nr:ABC transporter permease subunit [Deltaproteobacteria bacterium]